MQTHFEVAVVGGGIMGLSAAWQLCRRGVGVVLVDRYRVGHVRGSSHGESRVARAAYADPLWASLARESLTRSWPELERAAGSTLLHRQPVYLFGPSQGAIGQYAEAVESIEGIASIAAERAREHAAALRIADEDLVLEDRTGGVIHAEATMAALRAALLGDGATIKEGLALLTLRPGSQRLVMETEQGVIEADKVVLAGGAWMGELVPELSPLLHVCRQSVGFAKVDGPTEPTEYPVWAHIDHSAFTYGLPAVNQRGPKLAHHVLRGPVANPRDFVATASHDAQRTLLNTARSRFCEPVTGLHATESCLYTSTHNEDFILDRHPSLDDVWVAAGFSGHGFKFGPLVGELLAQWLLDGHPPVNAWTPLLPRLSIAAHQRAHVPGAG